VVFFFFQAEDGIRDRNVTGVQTCALPIYFELLVSYFEMRDGIALLVDLVQAMTRRDHWLRDDRTLQSPLLPLRQSCLAAGARMRSEERRVGKEWRSGWSPSG